MDPLTATDVRGLLPTTIDLGDYGYAVADPDPLEPHAAMAGALLPGLVGRTSLAAVPSELEPIAKMAISLLALKSAIDLSQDRLETLVDFDLIKSLTVGGYTEQRREAEDALKARQATMTGWPQLDFLLTQLMTPEKYEEWLAILTGQPAPAWAVTEVGWGGDWLHGEYGGHGWWY
jgi:hypothetical protein